MNKKLIQLGNKYPLAFRLSEASKVKVILWFISWQLNNPDNKIKIDKKKIDKLKEQAG